MKRMTGYYIAAIVAVVAVNSFAGVFRSGQLAVFLSLAVLAVSLDLVWGYTGILSLGQLLPFGTAAYVTARMATAEPSWSLAALAASVIVGAAISGLIAAAAFYRRLSLVVVGLLTLMLSLTFEKIANQWNSVTGGFNGLSGVPSINLFGVQLSAEAQDLAAAILAVTIIAAVGVVVSTPLGAVLIGIRDNERRMQTLGYNTIGLKIMVFALGGAVAGAAGWLNVHQTGFVSPGKFGFVLATNVVLWTLVGGRGTIIGPVIGTLVIGFASATLADSFLQYWVLATGVLFIASVILIPDGLVPFFLKLLGRPARPTRTPNLTTAEPVSYEADSSDVIAATNIDKSYGPFRVLEGVDLTMAEPELRCLIGPNGAGKSTFLDVLGGQQPHQGGTISMFGTDVTNRSSWQFARHGISRKFQAPQVIGSLSVAENIAVAAWSTKPTILRLLTRSWAADVGEGAMRIIEKTGLDDRRDTPAGDLSHGEKQWLEIAMAMAGSCRMLLLDEPTAGMTVEESLEAAELLRELHSRYELPIVIVEHDMAFIRAVADRVTVLADGGLIADGTVAEVEADPQVRAVYLGADHHAA